MKRNFFTALLIAGILAGGCVTYKATLQTQTAGAIDAAGTYSVIKYARNYGDVYSTVAFIVPERGKYTFRIFKPDFEYKIVKGVSGAQAVEMAQTFVKGNPYIKEVQLNGIIGPAGDVTGYEVRPIYRSILFGREDILVIGYFLNEGNEIQVHIDVDEVVKQREKGDDGGN
jgi:hypothetical protein